MNNTIQLYMDENEEIKGYPITSPDRVIDENGITIKEQLDIIAYENFVVASPSTISQLLKTHKKIKLTDEIFNMDIILSEGTEIIGSGGNSYINGILKLNTNCKVSNLKLGGDDKAVLFENNTTNVIIDNCFITKGLTSVRSGGGIYANDIHLSNVYITNCTFTRCNSNGIKLVHKGSKGNIHDIYVENCKFFDNTGMNFEIFDGADRSDTIGYKNINIKSCYFDKEENSSVINVSYDGNFYTNGDEKIYRSGYSIIENCTSRNGHYSLELAGASHMSVINNNIIGGSVSAVSTSQLNGFENSTEFRNNTIMSDKQSVFAGNNCIIEGNKFINSFIIVNKASNTELKNNLINISVQNVDTFRAIQIRSSKECRILNNTIDFRGSRIININFVALQYDDTINTLIRGNNFYRPANITGGNNIAYDIGCKSSLNKVMNNFINDNFSENGESLYITKTITSSINNTNKKIITLTNSIAGKGHPETIVEVECVCRHGNTTKFTSAKIYFCNYSVPDGNPIILQSEGQSQYIVEIIKELVDNKYSYTIKIKDEFSFDTGMKKVSVTQNIPIDSDKNNYFIIN